MESVAAVTQRQATEAAARLLIGVEGLMRRCGSPGWVIEAMHTLVEGPTLPAPLRARLGVVLGARLAQDNDLPAAQQALDAAEAQARAVGDPGLLGTVLYRFTPLAPALGGSATEARVREGVALLEGSGLEFELAEARAWLAWLRTAAGDLVEARALFDMALGAMRRHGFVALLPQTLNNRGQLFAQAGDWAAAAASTREGIEYAVTDGFGLTLAILNVNHGESLLRTGDLVEARDALERAREHAREVADPRRQGLAAARLAWLAALDGAFDEGAQLCEEATVALRRAGRDPATEALNLALRAVVEAGRGRRAQAEEFLAHVDGALADRRPPDVVRALALHRLHVDFLTGKSSAAETRDALATARGGDPQVSPGRPHLVSDAARLLEASLYRETRGASVDVATVPEPTQRLVVAADGTWFRAPGGERVSLERKASARKVISRLVAMAVTGRNLSLTADSFFEIGWPGDRTPEPYRSNRVYVLVAKLRAAGLGPWLLHDGNGYRLDLADASVVA